MKTAVSGNKYVDLARELVKKTRMQRLLSFCRSRGYRIESYEERQVFFEDMG
jgi:hypothetical protein